MYGTLLTSKYLSFPTWSSPAMLISQPGKCNIMQIRRKRTKKISASYTFEGRVFDNVEKIKYLDTTFTNGMKWNIHITNVCAKVIRTLTCPQDVKESAYKTLSMVVQFWTPKVYFFKLNLRRCRKGQLDL